MKPRISGLFIECYRFHSPNSRAKIHELMHLLCTLYKYVIFPDGTQVVFTMCDVSTRKTWVKYVLDPNLRRECIEVTLEDIPLIIDEILKVADDEETLRLFRKKKLELEISV